MFRKYNAQLRPKACQITGRGEAPANQAGTASPGGATDLSAYMLCRPFRAKVTTASLQGFHPCLWPERPFGALRLGICNFRNFN